tara:strand:- start:193 stop:618 length:426 start_codon:yes stop_codon:yes gene_type:complete
MKAIFILEGSLNENDQHQLSKDVEQLSEDWGLTSYLDDVVEDDVCEHNNTITNECSNCNEQERKDYTDTSVDDSSRANLKRALLTYILKDIKETLFATNNFVIDRAWELAGEWSSNDYKVVTEGGLDSELVEEIINRLTVK